MGAPVAVAAFYFIFDPASAWWMPRCPLKAMTGLQCPGCGSQRLLHALLHGDLQGAWQANALLLLSIPGIVFLGWLELRRERHPRLYARIYRTPFIIAVGVVLAGWGVIRNIAGI